MQRSEAISRGLKRYISDKPCKYGHSRERYTSTGNCCECMVMARDRTRQAIASADMGWPSITAHVPVECLDTLRAIVHDMRGHGVEFDRRRAKYAELAHDLHINWPHERITDSIAVTLTPPRPRVTPYIPTDEEQETGKATRAPHVPSVPSVPAVPTAQTLQSIIPEAFRHG